MEMKDLPDDHLRSNSSGKSDVVVGAWAGMIDSPVRQKQAFLSNWGKKSIDQTNAARFVGGRDSFFFDFLIRLPVGTHLGLFLPPIRSSCLQWEV